MASAVGLYTVENKLTKHLYNIKILTKAASLDLNGVIQKNASNILAVVATAVEALILKQMKTKEMKKDSKV